MPSIFNRRQFGSFSAAAVLASLRRVRPEHDLHRTINQFCDRQPGSRSDLTAPFVVSSMAYDTDGRVLILDSADCNESALKTRLAGVGYRLI